MYLSKNWYESTEQRLARILRPSSKYRSASRTRVLTVARQHLTYCFRPLSKSEGGIPCYKCGKTMKTGDLISWIYSCDLSEWSQEEILGDGPDCHECELPQIVTGIMEDLLDVPVCDAVDLVDVLDYLSLGSFPATDNLDARSIFEALVELGVLKELCIFLVARIGWFDAGHREQGDGHITDEGSVCSCDECFKDDCGFSREDAQPILAGSDILFLPLSENSWLPDGPLDLYTSQRLVVMAEIMRAIQPSSLFVAWCDERFDTFNNRETGSDS